jgi:hypothetical protein
MSVEKKLPDGIPTRAELVLAARRLLRTSLKGALATLDHENGHPYVSLVLVATQADSSPVFLLSSLARHGKNIRQDGRASLLLDGTEGQAEPLTGNRMTLFGEVRNASIATARRRFLARHDSAGEYVDFGDFAFFTFEVTGAHFIGGFGRIFAFQPAELMTDITGAEQLLEAEPEILAHMNEEHAEAIALYATELAGAAGGDWRMTGIDPAGMDLLHCSETVRLDFERGISNPEEARSILVALAHEARSRRDHPETVSKQV